MSDLKSQIKEALANYELEVSKFDEKENKAAGVRARKSLQSVIALSKQERNRITETNNARKEQN